MRYLLIVLVITFFCFACQESNNSGAKLKKEVTYYDDGKIKSEGYLLKNEYHGSYKQYYPNGKLKVEAYFIHGKQDSIQRTFYKNGIISQEANFDDDKIIGEVRNFDTKGILVSMQNYIVRNDSSILNEIITYNTNNEIIKEQSSYFSLESSNDTIFEGDTFKLSIKLEASLYNMNMLVLIGNYDKDFNLVDSTSLDTLRDRSDSKVDFKVEYLTDQYTVGDNKIRGVIYDYVSYYESDNTDDIIEKIHPLYFEKEFYVRRLSR